MRLVTRVIGIAVVASLLPTALFAQPAGFVYALLSVDGGGNAIYGFAIEPGTGLLTPLTGFPIATGGAGSNLTPTESIEYDEAQGRLYAINQGSNSVSVFNVNRVTGALSTAFSPIALGATPGCLAIAPDGGVLAVGLNTNAVSAFRIGTGGVTPAPGNPYPIGAASPFSCVFSRDGGRFYTGGNVGTTMAGFSVNAATADLTTLPGSPFEMGANFPIGYAIDSAERLFATGFSDHLARAYSIAGGPAVALGATADTGQIGPVHGLLSPLGFYLTTARTSNTVAVLRVTGAGAGTALTPVAGSPFATGGTFAAASATDATGRVIVTANGTSRNLTSFLMDPVTGTLTAAGVQPANSLGTSGRVSGVAFARFVPTTLPPPPTITNVPDQVIPQNGTATVTFSVAGSVPPSALRVTVASANTGMLPVHPSTLALACDDSGRCTLRISPADGRAGVALILLTVSDGLQSTSTNFIVTVPSVQPSAPAVLLVSPLGSGFALTWSPSETGEPPAYAVSWGTDATASNLPLQLVRGALPRFEVTAIPNGTYFFRVYAVGPGGLSPSSPLASVTIGAGAAAPGPPLALRTAAGPDSIMSNWSAPALGAAPAIYEVHVGSALGASDAASATTTSTTHTASSLAAGNYWVRTRAAAGGLVGPWSSSVQIPVAPAPCTAPPGTPILLPVTTTPGQVTFTWIATGAAAATYDVQIALGAGLPPAGTLSTTGPGASLVWNQASGSFAARLVANNACGASARSNEVSFTIQ